ncbi:TlpA disulfide reductase family protein [Chryseobacterium sp. BIGb0232]|uniref:TlpA family protein disulfide reductase n=1 Tax=Chryseobacterium sp. BIGb0232 TaxID=2940598 RepID=UPI000F478B02|nr:TlpA disulfide reductase family protein [Chryseobacterium sp. BIGb0232]MCS4302741.1 thiol-disulfide isomerase/thioredoxin [Chryseobacterium sp. BIGb0232]ROS17394.1 thiol-disulfide isomerase/thioredoxin [Chryseobacterium nakagawai]
MKQTIKLNAILIFGFIFFQNFVFANENELKNSDGSSETVSSITGDDLIFVNEKREKIALSDLKGKVVFVNFWATWCRPCVEEMASINELKKKLKDKDIVFVMLNIEADLEKAKNFMVQRKLDLPVYVVGKTISPDLFKNVVPTTLIYNKKGQLEGNIQGMTDFNDPKIYEALKQLLEK